MLAKKAHYNEFTRDLECVYSKIKKLISRNISERIISISTFADSNSSENEKNARYFIEHKTGLKTSIDSSFNNGAMFVT